MTERRLWGIIWLASYPKSGNTWLRAFLANYLQDRPAPVPINELVQFSLRDGFLIHHERLIGRPAAELSMAELARLRPKVHEHFATAKGQTVFVKTHNLVGEAEGTALITPAATAGAIYILRNPLDLAVSYAHHYRVSLDRAVEIARPLRLDRARMRRRVGEPVRIEAGFRRRDPLPVRSRPGVIRRDGLIEHGRSFPALLSSLRAA